MVIENFLREKWIEKKLVYSLFLGVFFTLVSFAASYLIFNDARNFIGISTILFTVILIVPTVNKLFDIEERIELKENASFFKKHEYIIDFFLYFFVGVFIVLFIIALISPNLVFSEEKLYNINSKLEIKYDNSDSRLPPPPPLSGNGEIFRIFRNNAYVMLISFFLSLFYGSGAFFLITLNASIFASSLAEFLNSKIHSLDFFSGYSYVLCNLGILFFHAIPEVFGYLLAAIAGGVLSHAFIREKFRSRNFMIVLKDSLILLTISIGILLAAAFLENEISRKLLTSDICSRWKFTIIIALLIFLVLLAIFEYLRKKKVFSK